MLNHGSGAYRASRGLLLIALLAVTVCQVAYAQGFGFSLPRDVSEAGYRTDNLYKVIFYLVAVIFFLTEGALLYFIIKYRARPGAKPFYIQGSNKAEWIWTVIPGIILLVLAVTQIPVWVALKVEAPPAETSFRVQAVAQQFNWIFRYAGGDGAFGTPDDVTSAKLIIPVHKQVLVQLRSKDVIHSFFLPNLRVKQDATPGLTVQTWFAAKETGEFEIACAELCGLGHYKMRSFLVIQPSEEVDQWLSDETKRVTEEGGEDPEENWGWPWQKMRQCSAPIPGEWHPTPTDANAATGQPAGTTDSSDSTPAPAEGGIEVG